MDPKILSIESLQRNISMGFESDRGVEDEKKPAKRTQEGRKDCRSGQEGCGSVLVEVDICIQMWQPLYQ